MAEELQSDELASHLMGDLADFHVLGGELDTAFELRGQGYQRAKMLSANERSADRHWLAMAMVRVKQSRHAEAMQMGVHLWSTMSQRVRSANNDAYREEIAAELLLALEKARETVPNFTEPPEAVEWRRVVADKDSQVRRR